MLKLNVFRSVVKTSTNKSWKNNFAVNAELNYNKEREEVILTFTEVI